jgi:hypothetical protein
MAQGDVNIITFNAGDTADADTKMTALSIVAADKVVTWQQNNQVFVAQIKTA